MDAAQARAEALKILESAARLSADETLGLLGSHVAHNYGLLLKDPIVRGEGPWLYTRGGRKLFDGVAAYSAANLGHGHPLVKAALKAFLDSNAPTVLGRFLPDPWLALFGHRVTALTGFDAFLPANGGVEGPEAAIKLARRWAKRVKKVPGTPQVLFAEHCFHGRTLTVTQMFDPDEKVALEGFGPFAPGFTRVPYNDLAAMEAAITPDTAAILVEPIQGEGGVNVPDPGYVAGLRSLCTRRNVLLILDEVQTGWGRTGELFCWQHGGKAAQPDIMCIGKSISGGFAPVGGNLASRALMDLFEPGSHGSTFGGCPISSAIAVAALRAMELEDLPRQAREKGAFVMQRLKAMAGRAPRIREVRGMGMMFGIELTQDGPDGHDFALKLAAEGLIVKDTHHWVLRFTPPIVATQAELEFALGALERVFCAAPVPA
ncbi:MAG: aspartate aminotransferase family protein [Planctomycetes bacterium]|nr:aspartate aminotransferase family protein [Planctomycetota bacterium]